MPRGARSLAPIAAAVLAVGGSGCASVAPACDALCPVARPAFEGCMEEWGLSYGEAVGYADGDDYDNWCATWVMEQRVLVQEAGDPAAKGDGLDERCLASIETLETGDCLSYWGLWD